MEARVFVGTAGMSVWFSEDGGETWERPYSESGLYLESRVWALSTHPGEPDTLLAGTDRGLFSCALASRTWTHIPSPMDGMNIWALARERERPEVILAGTQPAALFRSDDGGGSWRRLPVEMASGCIFVQEPRVTGILVDPGDGRRIWAGVEIDGVHASEDGGARWERRNEGLRSEDIHGLALVEQPERALQATTNKGLHRSTDEGRTWTFQPLDSPWQYTRFVTPSPRGDGTLFLGNGNGPPGDRGRLLVSRDGGLTWSERPLPATPNSTPWCLATNEADPDLLFLATNLGQLFRSTDGGETWTKLARELGEVRAIAWVPG